MSAEVILKTKLLVPPLRPSRIKRTRLIERLTQGLYHKLTLVSAPAGFGKTTLLSEWVGSCDRASAWLSLDEADSNPGRFLTYILLALQTADPRIGAAALEELQSQQPPPAEAIVSSLLNDIVSIENELILVLDDYHVIDSEPVEQVLRFLLDNLPPQMHLVIATREDPLLPLARLRADDQLTELRAEDLRFSAQEASAFLNTVMDLNLSPEIIATLETRTEGWIAGLQMAALSMRGRDDHAAFIEAFAGSHHYVLDYLATEVLMRQPESVRRFLRQTSILSRLSGPLCDAVTDEKGSKAMLEALESSNLFVVPLDYRRQWYRYHLLFAEVLQARLLEKQPDLIPILHQRASRWYEQNGLRAEAVRHALKSRDFEFAGDLVELAWPETQRSYVQSAIWLGWVRQLPQEPIQRRPVLSAGYAWALLDRGELEAAELRLRDAERWLEAAAGTKEGEDPASIGMVVADEEGFRSLPISIAAARAYLAQASADVPGTLEHARRVLELLPEGEHPWREPATALLGIAHWTTGDLEAACHTLVDRADDLLKAGTFPDAIGFAVVVAGIRMAQGRLRDAEETIQRTLQSVTERGETGHPEAGDLHIALCELYCERGDLGIAAHHLEIAETLSGLGEVPGMQYRLCTAQAGVELAQGRLDAALQLLNKAERLYTRSPLPDVRPVGALKCRVWLAQGRLSEALDWVREQGLLADGELSYLREFEYITLVRVLLTCHQDEQSIGDAMRLIERLLLSAKAGGRTASVIEISLLQALTSEAQGNRHQALAALERALELAKPEGYLRVFVAEGQAIAELLSAAAAKGIMPAYASKLAAEIHRGTREGATASAVHAGHSAGHLVEPLSARELEVLRLVAEGLSNREISERLFLAIDTVKGHNRRIFGKLQVKNRTEATARGRELGLV